jgi:hypothetical protein
MFHFGENEYLIRHGRISANLHYSICKALGIETTDKWYAYTPKSEYDQEDITVLWN